MAITVNGAAGRPLANIDTIMAFPEFAPLLALAPDELMREIQRRGMVGFNIAEALTMLPPKTLSKAGKFIASTIANFTNPQGKGACTAGRARIAENSETSVASVDRFTSSQVGKALFTNYRPQDADRYDTATRTLTREFMLFVLALDEFKKRVSRSLRQVKLFALEAAPALLFRGRKNVKNEAIKGTQKPSGHASQSDQNQHECTSQQGTQSEASQGAQNDSQNIKNFSLNQKKKSIPLVAKLKKLAGGDKIPTAAELKAQQEQNRIRGKKLATERAYHERQQADRKNEGRIMAMVRGMMNKGWDVNAISEPDIEIPPGWRCAPCEPRAAAPAPVMPRLTPLELAQIDRAYHYVAADMPTALADKARAAGIELK